MQFAGVLIRVLKVSWVDGVLPLILFFFDVIFTVGLIVRLYIDLLLFVEIRIAPGVGVVRVGQVLWVVVRILRLGVDIRLRQWEPILSEEVVDVVDRVLVVIVSARMRVVCSASVLVLMAVEKRLVVVARRVRVQV